MPRFLAVHVEDINIFMSCYCNHASLNGLFDSAAWRGSAAVIVECECILSGRDRRLRRGKQKGFHRPLGYLGQNTPQIKNKRAICMSAVKVFFHDRQCSSSTRALPQHAWERRWGTYKDARREAEEETNGTLQLSLCALDSASEKLSVLCDLSKLNTIEQRHGTAREPGRCAKCFSTGRDLSNQPTHCCWDEGRQAKHRDAQWGAFQNNKIARG